MCDPTPQDYFSNHRTDDLGIGPQDRLLRHCTTPVQVVPCPLNGRKISDQAFKPKKSDVGVSVDLECLLAKDGHTWEDRFGVMPNAVGMIAVTVASARTHSAGVAYTPKPAQAELDGYLQKPNPYHGEIILPMTNSQRRDLFRSAVQLRLLAS